MNRRKGIIAVIVALVGLGFAALPARAELHSVTIVLITGERITRTVDIPPGTPVSSISIPGITGTISQIIDNGVIAVPTPQATPQLPVPTVPAVPGVTRTPTPTPTRKPGNDKPGSGNRAPNQSAGEAPNATTAPTGNQKFRAGNLNTKKLKSQLEREAKKKAAKATPGRAPDGSPTTDNPTFSLALPGAAPIGVPNFFIDKFRIPPFLLPLYQAAGIEYGVRWEVLAAINEIETDYGRNLNVSTAGALGWMQFMPSTWEQYGVDANKDDLKDPYNPADAIFAAARYLKAAGAEQDLRKAIFAYNHADWYVDSVLMRARLIGGLPSNLVGSLTGLTQGHFPVAAKATYADDLSEAEAKKLGKRSRKAGNRALVVEGSKHRRGIKVFARRGAPVVAVNDGKIVRIGRSKRLGRFIQMQDPYGNTYTYARLAKVAKTYPAPRQRTTTAKQVAKELALPAKDAAPTAPASATTEKATERATAKPNRRATTGKTVAKPAPQAPVTTKQRLFAHPTRPNAERAGGRQQEFERTGRIDGNSSFKSYFSKVFGLDRTDVRIKRLRPGSRVVAGTILGRIGQTSSAAAPHVLFEIRPAGRGAPRIDPKPILDGWKLLESTAIYRAAGKNPFFGPDAEQPTIGQILLMSKEALVRHVLANPRIEIYGCGRDDIRTGQVDRRVLATLEFLSASGMRPTVSTLKCGHSFLTTSGNVSQHSSGNAVDIAKINGIPILGNQGSGSITELAVRRLLTLQGTMKPDQIITLMEFDGADNTLAMADHNDHIHIGWRPLYGTNSKAAKQVNAVLKPKQWIKLIDRLETIDNPTVRLQPSKHALKVTERASEAHRGE